MAMPPTLHSLYMGGMYPLGVECRTLSECRAGPLAEFRRYQVLFMFTAPCGIGLCVSRFL